MTMDILARGVLHPGIDNYFTVSRDMEDGAGDFPTDVGLTLGVSPSDKLLVEVGVDLLEPSDHPLYFNAKAGTPENGLFRNAPAIQAGIFNVGTEEDVTNYNILYGVIGKTLPPIGRLSAGPYIGNGDVLVDAEGDEENTGLMVAFDRGFRPVQDAAGNGYNSVVFAADWASGKNALGGGGFGLYYYFTKDVSLLVGPVWFNEEELNGKWKWTTQLDINQVIFD
jgi:hypothetical protein